MKRLLTMFTCVCALSCGSKSPTTPSPTTTTAATRVIALSGNMDFGSIQVGSNFTATLHVTNSGNGPLTITGISAPSSLTGVLAINPTSATIPAGGSTDITVRFTPASAQTYSGTLTVNGDQTSGTNTIQFTGSGSLAGLPLFSKTGSGNAVFDIPNYVARIRITGTYNAFSSNFVVKIAGRLIVNDLLGTGWSTTTSDGTYLVTNGGTAEVTNSLGVNWTFTEVR